MDRAIDIVREILAGHSSSWGGKPPQVFFEDLAADSLTLVAYVWHHPADFWDYLAVQDRINIEILQRFGEEGISFAFPTRTVVMEPGSAPIAITLHNSS